MAAADDEVRGDPDRARAEQRLAVVEALIRALDRGPEIDEAIEASADKAEARRRLTSPPFGFTPVEAEHVLDRMLWQRTGSARAQLDAEAADLRDELGRA